jgi:hypothetical protein
VGYGNLKKDVAIQKVTILLQTLLIFYCDMNFVWVREADIDCCTRNVRSGLAWFKDGTWKLRIINGEVTYKGNDKL